MSKVFRLNSRLLWAVGAVASGLLCAALFLPLWKLRMESPQYQDQDALHVAVYAGALRGDLKEITVLNRYIGVHIPSELPQLRWLPVAFLASGALCLRACSVRGASRSRLFSAAGGLLAAALFASAALAQYQMHRIGHQRDAKTALVGVKNFTPPLMGTIKVANFTLHSKFAGGAYLAGVGMMLELAAAWLSRPTQAKRAGELNPPPETPKQAFPHEITA